MRLDGLATAEGWRVDSGVAATRDEIEMSGETESAARLRPIETGGCEASQGDVHLRCLTEV